MPSLVARVGLAALSGCSTVLGLDDLVADRDDAGSTTTGTGSTTTTTSGSGGCASTCGTPGCGTCPATARTPVPAAGGDYEIDRYEVTIEQYSAWLATGPSTAGQTARCPWNDSFEPGVISQAARDAAAAAGLEIGTKCDDWLASKGPLDQQKPITCIDYCDAVAYCAWAGGHLCGKIGGGTLDVTSDQFDTNATDPELSEWYRACSNAGAQLYPYGDTYMAGTCNDTNGHIEAVGTFSGCEGGYPDIFDMSGNVGEWEDACTNYGGTALAGQNCLRVGGAYYDDAVTLTCGKDAAGDTVNHQTVLSIPSDGTGFRCCK